MHLKVTLTPVTGQPQGNLWRLLHEININITINKKSLKRNSCKWQPSKWNFEQMHFIAKKVKAKKEFFRQYFGKQ